jgi:GT2 family glycosyltransferase
MVDGQPDVSVVVVSYNTRELLAQCLSSIIAQTPDLGLEVIVVDNASVDGSPELVRHEFEKIRLIANGANVGLARANNQGIRAASGRYVLLLNPDTVILDRAIEQMVHFMDAHPEAGICGPRLVYPDGADQRSTYPFPSLSGAPWQFLGLYSRYPTLGRWLAPEWIDFRPAITREVGWCGGACLMIARARLGSVGLSDENFFYADDVDLCRRTWQSGWRVYYFAEARVVHFEGASQDSLRRRQRILQGEIRYLRKWRGPAYAATYRTLVRLFCLYHSLKIGLRARAGAAGADAQSPDDAFCQAVARGSFGEAV